jgi:hypothetical protein
VAGHQLIDRHLAELARLLPARAVDELADGLHETWQHHLAAGRSPAAAATAAIAEFGTTAEITAAFTAQAPGRRAAQLLLASGPLVGLCWGASLVTGQVWTWPIPAAAIAGFAAALLATVAVLLVAATSRHSYRRTRLGGVGGLGLFALDLTMIAAAVLAAPGLGWPAILAIPASLIRIGWILRSVPAALAR